MQIEGLKPSPSFDNIVAEGDDTLPTTAANDAEIERYARRYGVDPDLVQTIMERESGGESHGLSGAELRERIAHIENVCKALREEALGSIYDENVDETDDIAAEPRP